MWHRFSRLIHVYWSCCCCCCFLLLPLLFQQTNRIYFYDFSPFFPRDHLFRIFTLLSPRITMHLITNENWINVRRSRNIHLKSSRATVQTSTNLVELSKMNKIPEMKRHAMKLENLLCEERIEGKTCCEMNRDRKPENRRTREKNIYADRHGLFIMIWNT